MKTPNFHIMAPQGLGEGLQEGLEYTEFRIISETQLQSWANWEEEPALNSILWLTIASKWKAY